MGFPKHTFKHLTKAILILLTLTLVMTGCAFQKDSTSEKILRLSTGFKIKNLIPAKNGFWGNEFGFAELLLRPEANGIPSAWILKKVTNLDELTWSLELNPDVHFQNGKKLDAKELANLMNYHLANTDSVKAVLPSAEASATTDLTVVLKTKKPTPQVPNILADEAYFTIFDLAAYQASSDNPDKLIKAKIYTGPYVPTSLTDSKLEMKADPNYWGGKLPLDSVVVNFVDDAGARIKAVQNNEVDIALYPPSQAHQTLKNNSQATFILGEAAGPTFCFYLNQHQPVFKDARVRRAILSFIDYKAIAKDVMQGVYEPATSLYDPKLPYAVDIWKTDIQLGNKLLTEANAKKVNDSWILADGVPLKFEILTYPQQPDSGILALALQSQLKAQGITVTIKQVPDMTAVMKSEKWDSGISGNGTVSLGGSPIPPLTRSYLTNSERNYSHISDSTLDELIKKLEVTIDKNQTKTLLQQIQTRIGEQGHNGYLGRRRTGVVAGTRMKHYQIPVSMLWVDAKTKLES